MTLLATAQQTDANPVGIVPFADAALARLWRRGLASRPSLDPEHLVAHAARQAGDGDAGPDDGWHDRLTLLCSELETLALPPLARTIAHGQLVAALANRFRHVALWQRHSAIADWPMPAPVLIIGQMRSGSTRMQRLLACDPQFAHTRFYESWNPVPRWRALPFDDRRWRGAAGLAVARLINPAFGALHPTTLDGPDEEIGWFALSVYGAAFEAQWRVPRFTVACETMPTAPIYATFRDLLRSIAWQRRETRPWVMKVPQFAQDPSTVLATFPGARAIFLSRDPARVVASSVALAENVGALQSMPPARSSLAHEWTRKVALRSARMASARESYGGPQVEVEFEAMNRDWEAEIAHVYAALNLQLCPETLGRMRAYMAAFERASARRGSTADRRSRPLLSARA